MTCGSAALIRRPRRAVLAVLGGLLLLASEAASAERAAGDPARGAALFRQCAACHSLRPGQHLTGPSLAGILGRKAGSAQGFTRYSEPLKQSGVVWDRNSLDTWLRDPQELVPGTAMAFPGLPSGRARADLVAYLEAAGRGEAVDAPHGGGGTMGGGGMMGGGERPNLEKADRDRQVTAISYCGDGYRVTTASGRTQTFWEMNLRFKTDSSEDGPARGKPVLLPAGMMGDRASIVFAAPEEISRAIARGC